MNRRGATKWESAGPKAFTHAHILRDSVQPSPVPHCKKDGNFLSSPLLETLIYVARPISK